MKSTKEPTKIKPNRKRQADEEFKLIKGLTESIAERRKRKLIENQSASPDDAFGRYIIQTLAELDSNVKHLAQYHINDILFQAQTGELARSHSMGTRAPIQVPTNQHAFQPVHPQYNMPSISNQISNQRYNMSSQRDGGFNSNSQAAGNMWSIPNQLLPISTDSNSGQDQSIWCDSNQIVGSTKN